MEYEEQKHQEATRHVGFLFFFNKILFIYLAVPGLSCDTWDLQSLLWHVGSLFELGLGLVVLLEKEMAIYSSTLAWKIPWTEEPDGL